MSLLYFSTYFEHNCAHHQEVKIVSHSIWHYHTLQAAVRCTDWERTDWNANRPMHRLGEECSPLPTCALLNYSTGEKI